MEPKVKKIFILGTALGVSFSVLILSCAFYSNWIPMMMLVPLALMPPPVLFMDLYENSNDEGARAWVAMTQCLVGALVVGFYGIPLVMIHIEAVEIGQFILWIAADLITTFAVIYYFVQRGAEDGF